MAYRLYRRASCSAATFGLPSWGGFRGMVGDMTLRLCLPCCRFAGCQVKNQIQTMSEPLRDIGAINKSNSREKV